MLSDYSEYFLDAASEEGELSSAAHAALHLYGDAAVINEIVDGDPLPKGQWRCVLADRRRRAGDLMAEAMRLIEARPMAEQRAFGAVAVLHLAHQIMGLSEVHANWRFEDETKGGCLIPYRRSWRLTNDMRPTPRVGRRIDSPRAIRHYVKRSDAMAALRPVANFTAALPWPCDLSEADTVRSLVDDHFRAVRARRYDLSSLRAGLRPADTPKRRKTLRRASLIAAAVLGASAVSAFARGEPVEIRGTALTFVVERSRDLLTHGHGGLRVQLADDGKVLGGLCVYVENTPALDQLVAIALHAHAGEDRAILEAGNLYSVTEYGIRHPLIAEREAAKARAVADLAANAYDLTARFSRRQVCDRELFDLWRTAHWVKFSEVYVDALTTTLLGRKAKTFRALAMPAIDELWDDAVAGVLDD